MNNTDESTFVFRQLFDKHTGAFTYLMFDFPIWREGLTMHPVKQQFERSLKFIEELGVELKYVIDTHAHPVHVTSSCMHHDATGVKSTFGENPAVQCEDIMLCDEDELKYGRFKLKAISTLGNTLPARVPLQKENFSQEILC